MPRRRYKSDDVRSQQRRSCSVCEKSIRPPNYARHLRSHDGSQTIKRRKVEESHIKVTKSPSPPKTSTKTAVSEDHQEEVSVVRRCAEKAYGLMSHGVKDSTVRTMLMRMSPTMTPSTRDTIIVAVRTARVCAEKGLKSLGCDEAGDYLHRERSRSLSSTCSGCSTCSSDRITEEIGQAPDIRIADPFESCVIQPTQADVGPQSPTFGMKILPETTNVEGGVPENTLTQTRDDDLPEPSQISRRRSASKSSETSEEYFSVSCSVKGEMEQGEREEKSYEDDGRTTEGEGCSRRKGSTGKRAKREWERRNSTR